MTDPPKRPPAKVDPTVAKAKKAIAKKLEDDKLTVDDICQLVTALAKLQQADRRQAEGEWGQDL